MLVPLGLPRGIGDAHVSVSFIEDHFNRLFGQSDEVQEQQKLLVTEFGLLDSQVCVEKLDCGRNACLCRECFFAWSKG